MLKLNTQNSKHQLLATQKSHSNTTLNDHATLTLTNTSFSSNNSLSKTHILLKNSLDIHLDYLRISSTDLTKKDLTNLRNYLFSETVSKTINKPWHPHPRTSNHKKYDYRIVSRTGIVLSVKKRAKFKGRNTRYVYDIMIDFTGAYFADLSLLKQLELIYYLNSNYQLDCHRIDVAIDDYSRELFPVDKMIIAYLEDNQYGFQLIDDNYLDIVNNKFIGTLGIGSRRSSFFIRIYTKHRLLVRWETELKQNKAQNLFNKLAELITVENQDTLIVKAMVKTLLDAAICEIDFRDNKYYTNKRYARKNKTEQLPFWQSFIAKIYSLLEN